MGNIVAKKSGGRVLLVDDEKWICESLKLLLSRLGLDIDPALNGKDALASLEKDKPDLAILDFDLPDMDGLEVLAKIREYDMNLPVIFMTGYGSETISIRAFKLGISDYFIKPFNPKSLQERVLELLGEREKGALPPGGHTGQQITDPEIETSSGIGCAVNFIKNNYRSHISLDEISRVAGISRFHFTRAFKKVMGISFTDYLNHLRVRKAADALTTPDVNISEIAYSVGFNSLRQFERAFKNTCGKTPMEYRKEKRYPTKSSPKTQNSNI